MNQTYDPKTGSIPYLSYMKKYMTYLALAIGLFSCYESKKVADDFSIKEYTLNSDINKSPLADTVFMKMNQIVRLESINDSSLIRKIDRLYKSGNRLFIFDRSQNKIVLFNLDGKYINSINRLGRGPGEYVGLIDFCVDEGRKQILLLCHQPYKILWFDFDGNLLKEKKTEDLYKQISTDSQYIYCTKSEISSSRNDEHEFVIMNCEGDLIKDDMEIRKKISNKLFTQGNFLTKSQEILYSRRFENYIYTVSEGGVSPKYKIDFAKYSLPEDLINQYANEFEFGKSCRENNYIYTMNNIVDNDNFLLFKINGGFVVIDKNTGSSLIANIVLNTKYGVSVDYMPLEGSERGKIAGVINVEFLNQIKANAQHIENEHLRNLVSKVSEDDNPILVLYDLK